MKIVIKRFKRLYGHIKKLIVSPIMTDLLRKRIRLKYLFYYTCITTRAISFSSAVVCRFFLQFKLDFRLNCSIKNFLETELKWDKQIFLESGGLNLQRYFPKSVKVLHSIWLLVSLLSYGPLHPEWLSWSLQRLFSYNTQPSFQASTGTPQCTSLGCTDKNSSR